MISEAPILGKVRLSENIQSFTSTGTCYVTDLCESFGVILGNSFLISHRAVWDYFNFSAFKRDGHLYSLTPTAILTAKSDLHAQTPDVKFKDTSS